MDLPESLVEEITKKGGKILEAQISCNTHHSNGCDKMGTFIQKESGGVVLVCLDGHGMDEIRKSNGSTEKSKGSGSIFNSKQTPGGRRKGVGFGQNM